MSGCLESISVSKQARGMSLGRVIRSKGCRALYAVMGGFVWHGGLMLLVTLTRMERNNKGNEKQDAGVRQPHRKGMCWDARSFLKGILLLHVWSFFPGSPSCLLPSSHLLFNP